MGSTLYLRRIPSIDALIPALYLKGISTGNMEDALKAILGENAIGLSATFPNKEACERLITAILAEIHEDWMNEKKYLTF